MSLGTNVACDVKTGTGACAVTTINIFCFRVDSSIYQNFYQSLLSKFCVDCQHFTVDDFERRYDMLDSSSYVIKKLKSGRGWNIAFPTVLSERNRWDQKKGYQIKLRFSTIHADRQTAMNAQVSCREIVLKNPKQKER